MVDSNAERQWRGTACRIMSIQENPPCDREERFVNEKALQVVIRVAVGPCISGPWFERVTALATNRLLQGKKTPLQTRS